MALTKAPEELLDKDLTSALTITTADNLTQLTLKSTDADSSVGPILDLQRDSASPADSDSIGLIRFLAENDADSAQTYARIGGTIQDASDGTEDGILFINTITGGANRSRVEIDGTETVFNEASADIDFRVESDNSTHALFVQASDGNVGFNKSSPSMGIDLVAANNSQLRIDSSDTNDTTLFLDYNGGGATNRIRLRNAAGAFAVNVDNTNEAMRINSSTEIQIGGTTNAGFIDFDGNKLQLNTFRNPNSGAFVNTGKSHASIELNGSSGGSSIRFGTAASDNTTSTSRMIIESGGNVEITNGNLKMNSGNGIDFSDTSDSSGSMNSELLDDYEEGTWTPVLVAGTTNPTGGGAQNPQGSYTKIGNRVFVTYYVGRTWTNTPAGAIYVSGLPFTVELAASNANYHYVATYNVDFGGGMTMGVPSAGGTNLQLYQVTNNGAWTAINWTTHTNGTTIYLTGSFSYSV